MSNKFWLRVAIYKNGESAEYIIKGRPAETLWHLSDAGSSGLTAYEAKHTWAYRLAAYVHTLRQDYGLDIQTITEEHPGGHHARYVLIDAVELLEAGNVHLRRT